MQRVTPMLNAPREMFLILQYDLSDPWNPIHIWQVSSQVSWVEYVIKYQQENSSLTDI